MNILRVARNELVKCVNQKKLFFLLLIILCFLYFFSSWIGTSVSEVINNDNHQGLSNNFKNYLLSMNFVKFSFRACVEFIYKPFLPIYLIFISLIVSPILSDDYLDGNLKFSLLTKITKKELIVGKILGMFLMILSITLFYLIASSSIGFIKFGTSEVTFSDTGNLLFFYLMSVVPTMAFGTIILFLSLLIKNKVITTFGSIILLMILSNIDHATISKDFSPIGILSKYSYALSIDISSTLLQLGLTLVYILVFSYLIVLKFKNEDIVY